MKQGICLKDIPHRASITFPQTEVLKDVFPGTTYSHVRQYQAGYLIVLVQVKLPVVVFCADLVQRIIFV